MNLLLAETSLEGNVSMNMVMLGLDGRPQQKDLCTILREWLDYRMATVVRRLGYRLSKVEQRVHILEGRLAVLLRIEDVIRVIRESDEPKPELMARFGLSEIQTDDILDIRLRQLARLEGVKLERERDALQGESHTLLHLLADTTARTALVSQEIQADADRFGDDRRSEVRRADKAVLTHAAPDEAMTVVLSQNGWIWARAGHGIDTGNLAFKDGDTLAHVVETRSIHPLVVLDSKGRSYTLDCADLPTSKAGVPLTALLTLQDQASVVAVLSAPAASRWLVASSGGYGFIATLGDMVSRVKAGKVFLTVEANETALPPVGLSAAASEAQVVVANSASRLLAFPLAALKTMNKGRGLMLMQQEATEAVVAMGVVQGDRAVLSTVLRGGRVDEVKQPLAEFAGKRAGRGKPTAKKMHIIAIR